MSGVVVDVPCLCPAAADGSPRHPDGDQVTLRESLDFHAAVSVRNDARLLASRDDGATEGEYLATLWEGYVLHGVTAWSLVDARGKPLPPTRENLRAVLLADLDVAERVANRADDLYSPKVVLPLLARASTSSPASPMPASTSPTTSGGPSPRKRPSRSSTSTTPMAAIETTSGRPAGASKSSQSSRSAA